MKAHTLSSPRPTTFGAATAATPTVVTVPTNEGSIWLHRWQRRYIARNIFDRGSTATQRMSVLYQQNHARIFAVIRHRVVPAHLSQDVESALTCHRQIVKEVGFVTEFCIQTRHLKTVTRVILGRNQMCRQAAYPIVMGDFRVETQRNLELFPSIFILLLLKVVPSPGSSETLPISYPA